MRGRYAICALLGTLAAITASCGTGEPFADDPSYYLRELRRADLTVGHMNPTLLSPLARDHTPPHGCPEELTLRASNDTYDDAIRPFVSAVGSIRFPRTGDEGPLEDGVALALEQEWARIDGRTRTAPTESPVRVLVVHYNRIGAPGRCVTVRATFYTVPDGALDPGTRHAGPDVPGVLFMLWKTYQLEGGHERIVERGIEVTTGVQETGRRADFATLRDQPELRGWTRDGMAGGHFVGYGGGQRAGLLWIDRNAGLGRPDVWSGVYRLDSGARTPRSKVAPLPPAWQTRLFDVLDRL